MSKNDKKNKFNLKISSKTENLEIIRGFIENIAGKGGFEEEAIGEITLAVDEACSNVIRHAYRHNSRRKIEIAVEINSNQLIISISDKGRGFDPGRLETSDKRIKKYARGGLGIALIKKVMDEVNFDIHPGVRNQIIMTKYLPNTASLSHPS